MSTIAEDNAAKAAHDEAVRKAQAASAAAHPVTTVTPADTAAKKAKADALAARKADIDAKATADKAALDADPDGAFPFAGVKDVPPAPSHDSARVASPASPGGPPSPTPTTPAHPGEAGYPTPGAFRDTRKPE